MHEMNQNRNIIVWKNRAVGITEGLFLGALAVYLVYLTLETTRFLLALPVQTEPFLLAVLTAATLLKQGTLLLTDRENRAYWTTLQLASLSVALVWILSYFSGKYYWLLFPAVLTVGCVGTDYRKVLKVHVAAVSVTLLSAILCAAGGSIQNLVYDQGTRIRSSCGTIFPTDFASYFVYLSISAWVAWKDDLPDLFFLLPGLLSLLIARYVAASNTSLICSLLFLLAVSASALLGVKRSLHAEKLLHFLSAASFPCFAAGMFAMVWAYHEGLPFAATLNRWNHLRLSLASAAIDKYGFSLFGVGFRQIGAGGTVVTVQNYNYVDCSYMVLLLRYGIVTFAVAMLLWVLTVNTAAKQRNRQMLLGFLVIAVHCLSEQHYPEVNYNPFLVLPFSLLGFGRLSKTDMADMDAASSETADRTASKRWLRTGLVLLAAGLLAVAVAALFPWFTTLCTAFEMGGSVMRRRVLFLTVSGALSLAVLFAWLLFQVFKALWLDHRIPRKSALYALGAGLLCFAVGMLAANGVIARICAQQSETVERERPAVEAIQRTEGCRLYVDHLPSVYRRAFGGISRSIFHGEDLSRKENIAIITDADREYNVLIDRGFLYTEISDDTAVYTDSAEAAAALKAAGYHLTGYYSRSCEMDLEETCWTAYGMPLNDDGTINLSAYGPLRHNTELVLYAAPYRVVYDLQLVPNSDSPEELPLAEETVCTVAVTYRWGQEIAAVEDVPYSAFAEDGTACISLEFTVPTVDGAEYLAEAKQGNYFILLKGIRYQKVPKLDVHSSYNAQRQPLRQEFFDLEGNAASAEDGSYAREYEYDAEGNRTALRFLDREGNRIVNSSGYAEVRWTYNEKNQLLVVEYLDKDGAPVQNSSGYQKIVNEYTEKGKLSLTGYYNLQGDLAPYGSANFHAYLRDLISQLGPDTMVFLAIRDEGTDALTVTLLEDLHMLGIRTELSGKHRYSYLAVLSPEGTTEQISADSMVSCNGTAGNLEYSVTSAGATVGNLASILINGVEYARNARGINIVVLSGDTVIDSVAFDTYSELMAMTR